jgi:hypothetical protein
MTEVRGRDKVIGNCGIYHLWNQINEFLSVCMCGPR